MNTYTPGSNKIVHYTYADLTTRQIARPVHLVQYDDSLPIIAVKLYSDGVAYAVSKTADVNIRCSKSDGKSIYNPALGASSDYQTVYFEATQQMTALFGEVNFVVEILVDSGTTATGTIALLIDANPVSEASIESTSEFKTVKQYAEEAIDSAAAASSSATAAAKSATSAATSATNSNNYATLSKSWAIGDTNTRIGEDTDNSKYYAQQSKNSASSAATSASTATSKASAASSSATAAAKSATSAATSATNAANSESEAEAIYQEILNAEIGKYETSLGVDHIVTLPIYDSDGKIVFDSDGNEIQSTTKFVAAYEKEELEKRVANLEAIVETLLISS